VRIGLVTPYSWSVPGGVNSHVEHLAEELEHRGHTTWILAPVGVMIGRRRVDSRRLPATERLVPMGSAIPIPSNGSFAYLNPSPRVFTRMDRAIRQLHLDVLHVHEPCTPPVSMAAVLLAASPVVGTFHADIGNPAMYDRMGWVTRVVVERLDVRTAVSEEALRIPAARFPGEYVVIPNGVAVDLFAPARDRAKVAGRVLFVGRAEPRKGLAVLLQAFATLRHRRPDVTLVIAGASRRDVLAEAARAGDGVPIDLGEVTTLGWVGDDEKVRQLGAAEVVCVPSLWGESFGVVLIEALAAGVPVVASDLPAYRRVLRDGVAGRLTPPGDPVALAHALDAVLADEVLRQRFRTEGLAAADTYSWERVADQVEAVYRQAASLDLPRGRHGLPGRPWFGRALLEYWLWRSRIGKPREAEPSAEAPPDDGAEATRTADRSDEAPPPASARGLDQAGCRA